MPLAFQINLGGNMNVGDLLTLIRTNFQLTINTDNLTANRAVNFQDKDGTIALTSDITGGSSTKTVTTITANFTVTTDEINNIIECNSAFARTITIPGGNSFPVGSTLTIIQSNTGEVTITAGVGIQIEKFGGIGDAVMIGQYSRADLIKLAEGRWHCSGDVSI